MAASKGMEFARDREREKAEGEEKRRESKRKRERRQTSECILSRYHPICR